MQTKLFGVEEEDEDEVAMGDASYQSVPARGDVLPWARQAEGTAPRPWATLVLTAAQLALFGIELAVSGSVWSVDPCVSYALGAKWAPAVRFHGQVHRLLLPVMLHESVLHVGLNMLAQVLIMGRLELALGWRRVAAAYVLTALTASAASCLAAPYSLAVGASGALFGLIGVSLVDAARNREQEERQRLVVIVAINGIIGLAFAGIDLAAHAGGLVSGLVAGLAVIADGKHQIGSGVAGALLLAGMLLAVWLVPMEDRALCSA